MRRSTRNIAAAIVAGALTAVASPALADGQSPQSGEPAPLLRSSFGISTYIHVGIRNHKSKKYLQPSGGSISVGAKIVQNSYTGGLEQKWLMFDSEGSLYSFENNKSGLNLGIDGASTSAGAAAIQATGSGDYNQDWQVDWVSSSVFALKNRKSGMCLGISNASTSNGAQAAQFRCDGSSNQSWAAVPWGSAGS
ncbi:RICIN domain-containing protein [Streptomyces iakyrus]|uniref:RICIN domain-containing protein n=1 Tax=Streptomyces iakyrus TaxID=68219 RepID=UPI000998D077|nr:RICIN domain-containing protein [Streptomyces iakyrus]